MNAFLVGWTVISGRSVFASTAAAGPVGFDSDLYSPDDLNLPSDLLLIKILKRARARLRPEFASCGSKSRSHRESRFHRWAKQMRHIERKKGGSFNPLKRPKSIYVLVPLGQSGDKVRLSGPYSTVVHRSVISQALEQHGIKASGANDFANRNAGKAFVHISPLRLPALPQQKSCVVFET
jgi:hypothetical protein